VRPAAGGAAAADHLARDRIAGEVDANDESFGILVFAGVRFAPLGRVQEESSAPQPRLKCHHLRKLLSKTYRREKRKKRVTVPR
jgi:hypothetical protein